MFGVGVDGHPHLQRILMPPWWEGHPLRKESPGPRHRVRPVRRCPTERADEWQEQLRLQARGVGPAEQLERRPRAHVPQHRPAARRHPRRRSASSSACATRRSSTCVPDIGYHHRGAEKMGERQTWHTYIPYTDRVDYLGGVINNLPYVLAVEKLAGIEVPERAQVIRVHALRALPHRQPPGLLRHLRPGHRRAVAGLLHVQRPRAHLRRRHRGHHRRPHAPQLVPHRRRRRGPARGLGAARARLLSTTCRRASTSTTRWCWTTASSRRAPVGVGADLPRTTPSSGASPARSCAPPACAWDWRKKRPYCGLRPVRVRRARRPPPATATTAPAVRVEEMRQSLRIIAPVPRRTCPTAPYKADHPLADAADQGTAARCTTSRRSSTTSSA